MIKPSEFYEALQEKGINFFTGVPDSLLKDFNAYIMDNVSEERHVIAANEGSSIGLATGYHFTTGKTALVYMQNSGQGNAVNPLMSLADKEVYGIPMLLLIGWRGEPGVHDEPQHVKQGKITLSLLDVLEIPYEVISKETTNIKEILDKAITISMKNKQPYAIVVKKGSFEPYKLQKKIATDYEFNREGAIKLVTSHLEEKDIIVSTTGKTSRELFEYREELKGGHEKDFLTVGSMGHSSSIALGIALAKPNRQVYCYDGDGALIMHMGVLAIIGQKKSENFKHVIFNNGAHDSVGGQPTAGFEIDMLKIAESCGYKFVRRAETKQEIELGVKALKEAKGPALLEIKVNKGARDNLGRPTKTTVENKEAFMMNLEK